MTGTVAPKVRLGRTDLMVSPICFGTSGLGDMPATFGYSVSFERAAATVNAILDGPTTFIDLARIYGEGHGKERVGELFRIKEEGPAKAVGLAAGKVDMMTPLLSAWDFDALMTHNRFTLVNRNAEPMLDLAKAKGIAVMNAAPCASGVLAKGPVAFPRYAYQQANDAALEPIRRIEAIAARYQVPLGAAALQFSLRDKRVTSTVCGVTKPERVKETLDWARFPIPEAFWQEVATLPFATDDPEATRAPQKA
jgi:D-threo-aldose 1-dehydrogenase